MSGWRGYPRTRQQRKERLYVLARDPICYLQLDGCTQVSTIDEHVIGRAAGGSDDLSNRRGSCVNCNQSKAKVEAATARRASASKRWHPVEQHPGLRS